MTDKVLLLKTTTFFSISGADREPFLQALVTQDVTKVTQDTPQYACFLTPQGKFLYDFFIHANDDHYLIEIHDQFRDAFIKKLGFYKLRANVVITKQDDLQLFWSKHKVMEAQFQDPRHRDAGFKIITKTTPDFDYESDETELYHYHMIKAGIPTGAYDLIQDKTFLLDARLDHMHAIDFEKGCYIGQELTARMHFKKLVKKQLLPIQFTQAITAEQRTPILNQDDITIGEIYSTNRDLAFGMIRLEYLDDLKELYVNSIPGTLILLDYSNQKDQ